MSRSAAAAVSLLCLAACAGGEAASARSTVRDSAGVAVVESAAPAWEEGEGWRVDPEPEVEIGVVDGAPEHMLSGVRGVVRLADGRIAVADAGSHQVRWYDAAGRHLASAGRKGSGPGEFEAIHWIGRGQGDSVLVWDARSRRISVFGPEGTPARSTALEGLKMFPQVLGLLPDGSLVTTGGTDFAGMGEIPEGERREPVTYLRFSADGAPRDGLGPFPGPEQFVTRTDGSTMQGDVLFGRRGLLAPSSRGFWEADTDRFEFRLRDAAGRVTRVVRRPHQAVAVSPADVEAHWAGEDGDGGDLPPRMRAQVLRMQQTQRERTPHRPTFPAFESLREDATGHLWARHHRRPGETRQVWSVFDPEGRWLGEVETPEGLAVHEIGADYVLGVAKDELDVERVVVHPLRRSPER